MLHAAFVRSPHPHARVTRVDASARAAGCVALTPDDVADLGRYGCQARDQRVLADVARHAGDVVAAVAAPTREAAARPPRAGRGRLRGAARRLRPRRGGRARARRCCTPTPPARRSEAVSIGVRPLPGTNVCHRFRLASGDVAAGFAEADVVVEEAFRTAERAHTSRWSRTPRWPSGRTAG